MLDPVQTGGVDFSEFTPPENKHYAEGMLYYNEGLLTDKFFIKNVGVKTVGGFSTEGKHRLFLYNYKLAKIGDFVTTCPIKGTCFRCENKELAFGRIVEIYPPQGDNDGGILVGGADVVFL